MIAETRNSTPNRPRRRSPRSKSRQLDRVARFTRSIAGPFSNPFSLNCHVVAVVFLTRRATVVGSDGGG